MATNERSAFPTLPLPCPAYLEKACRTPQAERTSQKTTWLLPAAKALTRADQGLRQIGAVDQRIDVLFRTVLLFGGKNRALGGKLVQKLGHRTWPRVAVVMDANCPIQDV